MSTGKRVIDGEIVWRGRPWITPSVVLRTIAVIVVATIFIWLQFYVGDAHLSFLSVPLWAWTILAFGVIWILSLLHLIIFRASNSYILREDGLEIRQGIIRLHSFVVTPSGFGDLLVYQSIAGRIFGYGDLTVNSQGERQTTLNLVHSPFKTADTIRDIMGEPLVRVEGKT